MEMLKKHLTGLAALAQKSSVIVRKWFTQDHAASERKERYKQGVSFFLGLTLEPPEELLGRLPRGQCSMNSSQLNNKELLGLQMAVPR